MRLPAAGRGPEVKLIKGMDVFISVYNLHRNPEAGHPAERPRRTMRLCREGRRAR